MRGATYYGLVSDRRDEKSIINGLNAYLAKIKRTTSKTKNKGTLEGHLPYVFKHYYWNLNKAAGTFLALYPNRDERGVWVFEEAENCGWFAMVLYHPHFPGYDEVKSPKFINKALESTGCELIKLKPNPEFDSND